MKVPFGSITLTIHTCNYFVFRRKERFVHEISKEKNYCKINK